MVTGTRVAVLGLGASGRAAAHALAEAGAHSIVVDDAQSGLGVVVGAGLDPTAVDLIVASPGWWPTSPPQPAALALGIPVWSEVELAWRLRANPDAPWLAVTGTNGKTTTVEMLASILTAGGLRAVAAGNVGTPLVQAVADPRLEAVACELSSFQLHFTHTVAPRAACLLTLAPDHLDWHGSMESYAADKARIAERAEILITGPDPAIEALFASHDGVPRVRLSLTSAQEGEVGVADGMIVDHTGGAGPVPLAPLSALAHLGSVPAHLGSSPADRGPAPAHLGSAPAHRVLDALAAAALARAAGADPRSVEDGLASFRLGDHRGRVVATIGQVAYVDDSKATNPHAAAASLGAYGPKSVVWIAGGLAKGATFEALVGEVADRLGGVVLIGVDAEPLAQAMRRHAPHVPLIIITPGETDTVMSRAVEAARSLSAPGTTVLLAPAAASMDQFASYAGRGDAFAAAVEALTAQEVDHE
jgi:UDP-N-acetylmuramoylalanine--D-glutamate ligase